MYYENETIENVKMNHEVLEDAEFVDCIFVNCALEDCSVDRCSFIECKFINCNIISLKSKYSYVKYAEFEKCNLIGIHWNELLPDGRIIEPIRKLSHNTLKYNIFINLKFMRFDFSQNIIQDSTFEECDLRECSFKGDRLERTHFSNCDLRKSDFREASEYQIDITSNKLKGAYFSFPEVINLLSVLEIKID